MRSGCRMHGFAREKTYSRFYSSLFTDWPETPINTGGARGEECSTTLHNSSPLFTLFLHLLFRLDAEEFGLSVQNISAEEIRLLQKALYLVDCWLTTCHHRWLQISFCFHNHGFKIINNVVIHPQKRWGWRAVKSGEESAATLHTPKQLYISYLQYICEEWRVF